MTVKALVRYPRKHNSRTSMTASPTGLTIPPSRNIDAQPKNTPSSPTEIYGSPMRVNRVQQISTQFETPVRRGSINEENSRYSRDKDRRKLIQQQLEKEEIESRQVTKSRLESKWLARVAQEQNAAQERLEEVRKTRVEPFLRRQKSQKKEFDEVNFHNELYERSSLSSDEVTVPSTEPEETILNQLFEGEHQNLLLWANNTIILDTLAGQIHRDFAENILGKNIVDFLVEISLQHFTRDDARCFFEQYLFPYFAPVPYHYSTISQIKEDATYRYAKVERPDFYHDCINIIPKSWKKSTNNSIMRDVERIMKEICSDKYMNYTDGTYDYYKLSTSRVILDFVLVSGRLRQLNLFEISEHDRMCLFVNIYNMMVIHAYTMHPCANTEASRREMLSKDLYLIGPYKFSALDLINLLLGEIHAIPEYKFYLRQFAITNVDARVLMLLSNGCLGDPLPCAVSSEYYEKEITIATATFTNRDIDIDIENKCMIVHDMFSRYRPYFADNIRDLIKVLDLCLTDIRKREMLESLEVIDLIFRDYDWKSNRKENHDDPNSELRLRAVHREILALTGISPVVFSEDGLLALEEVMNNECYRDYLKIFSSLECSLENLFFWEMCQKYKRIENEMERFQRAMEMYETFIAPESQFQLNVYQHALDKLARTLKVDSSVDTTKVNLADEKNFVKLSQTVFDEINELVLLCICDIYSRFVVSELYKGMIEDVRQFSATMDKKRGSFYTRIATTVEEKGVEALSWRQDGGVDTRGNSIMSIDERLAAFSTAGTKRVKRKTSGKRQTVKEMLEEKRRVGLL